LIYSWRIVKGCLWLALKISALTAKMFIVKLGFRSFLEL